MSAIRLTVAAVIGTTMCVATQYGSSQTLRPAELPWTGSARCQLDIRGPGYTDQQIHTWTLMGGTPTILGAFHVYAATWSVTGGGSSQRTSGTQVSSSQWTRSGQEISAPFAVLARASDGAVMIQAYHGQLVARGALTGTQQVSVDGRPQPPTQILADAFEWAFPTAVGTPTSTTLSGSSSPAASGSLGYLQPAGTVIAATCSWNFTTAGQVSRLSTQQSTLTSQSGAQAGTGTQVTLSPTGSTTTIQQVEPTTTATSTLTNQPLASGSVVTSRTGTTLNTATASLLGPAPRTITLTGFTASGTSTVVAPRTITLAGFTAAGASSAVAPRTITLTGFTAAGTSAAIAPRTITLTGFTAAGTATAVAPRTITLTGWTSVGP